MTTNRSHPSLSRRRLLLAGAGGSVALLAGCGGSDAATDTRLNPGCFLTPEEIEGPFYTDIDLVRRDIVDGRAGTPLELQLTVVDAESCTPIPDASVDIWHADAGGLYSAFEGQGDDADVDTTRESFLRGVQPTDSNGMASFSTIYPGWYMGRTTHVHLKVHLSNRTRVTTQLYFPDAITSEVYAEGSAYAERGAKDTPNDDDEFSAELQSLRMSVERTGSGLVATHTLGIRRS